MAKIMKNLSLDQANHHTHSYSPMYCSSRNMQDPILTHELLIREYAVAVAVDSVR